jgi:hypothetical protein
MNAGRPVSNERIVWTMDGPLDAEAAGSTPAKDPHVVGLAERVGAGIGRRDTSVTQVPRQSPELAGTTGRRFRRSEAVFGR